MIPNGSSSPRWHGQLTAVFKWQGQYPPLAAVVTALLLLGLLISGHQQSDSSSRSAPQLQQLQQLGLAGSAVVVAPGAATARQLLPAGEAPTDLVVSIPKLLHQIYIGPPG